MLTRLLLPLVLFFAFPGYAQEPIRLTHSCSYDGEENESDYYTFAPSTEADRIVKEICDAMGLEKNFVLKSSNVRNAVALKDGGKRVILYSTVFLEKFKADTRTRWAAYSVLAHEIGHHLNDHNFEERNVLKRKQMELQADRFSGNALRLLGAPLDGAKAGIELFALEGETNTHPSGSARREAVASGWKLQDDRLKGLVPDNRPAEPVVTDSDGDGVPDQTDKCPRTRGLAAYSGCPDTDGDGLPDYQDDCPNEKGSLARKGCPEPEMFDMVLVKGGTFTMGCDNLKDCNTFYTSPAHSVTLNDFFIGKYEVTQAEWRQVMGSDPPELFNKECDQCPVEKVSWDDIQDFLQKLNRQTGMAYRLPTEAEWEYAARGGTKSKGYIYSGSNKLDEVGWYKANYQIGKSYGKNKRTHPVGMKRPNELGLYDMSGNVWEWCADWQGKYQSGHQFNPTGPATGKYRIFRGGSYYYEAKDCQLVNRFHGTSDYRYSFTGFRIARDP